VINFVVGRHSQANANQLVAGIKNRSDGHIPLFTSDELKHYDDAILEAYGIRHELPRTGARGRPRKPILIVPKDLLYAQVVKHRKRGRVVDITTRVVFGTEQAVAAKLQQSCVSHSINTSFVERNNLTMRHHNRRLTLQRHFSVLTKFAHVESRLSGRNRQRGAVFYAPVNLCDRRVCSTSVAVGLTRKTIAFSKKRERLEQQLHVAFAYYHFVKPHLGLRQRGKGTGKKYRDQTPMMAAGITDHIWTMSELFSQALFE